MEEIEDQSKIRQAAPEFQLLFWVFVLGAAVFLGYQMYSALWPEAEQGTGILVDKEGAAVGNWAPDFIGQTIEGKTVSLGDFRDKKPVLLVFWATWCGFCAQELEGLRTFTKENQREVEVIALTTEEPVQTVKEYIQDNQVNFLMLRGEIGTWNDYLVRGTPTHFLISKEGRVAASRQGVMTKEELEEFSL